MQNLWLWCARLAWAVLPITTGSALADALNNWSTAPAAVAAVLLWATWAAGLVALLAPRPWGLTLLRVVAPIAVILTIAAAPSTSSTNAVIAIASSLLAAALTLAAPFAQATGNTLAYGDEVRFPLHIPTPLLFLPVPLAILLVGAGVAAGPLLLADGRVVLGVLAIVIGFPLAAFLVRSLHGLSRRWFVMVPAGVVIVDPLILLDPVLMVRADVAGIGPTKADPALARALDLRLGSRAGSLTIALSEPTSFSRRRGRTDGAMVDTDIVLIAPIRRAEVLTTADGRRLARL
jgi:hypothetical protein